MDLTDVIRRGKNVTETAKKSMNVCMSVNVLKTYSRDCMPAPNSRRFSSSLYASVSADQKSIKIYPPQVEWIHLRELIVEA